MHYLSAEGISKSYGIKPLFRQLSFHIAQGDKVAFVAQNGAGKTTLFRILAGLEVPDEGTLWIHKEVRVAFLQQEAAFQEEASVWDNIFLHPHPVLRLIRDYEAMMAAGHPDSTAWEELIMRMDEAEAWQFETRIREILSRLQIDGLTGPLSMLSGGQRKRVALARALIDAGFDHAPTLLLMDEPTNHLDMEMIEWLEQYLDQEKVTLLLVTHDRYFLDRVCREILELDGGNLYRHRGDYAHYLEMKYARRQSEKASAEKTENLLRKELEWIRRQPKARTTKSKSRIEAFHLLKQKASGPPVEDTLTLEVKMPRLGGKVLELKKVYKAYGDKVLLKGFDYTFKKKDRIGIIGKNGVGKSTFVNLIQGIDKPDSGKINIGDTVSFGYYSQQGLVIEEDKRMIEWVKDIAENFPLADGTKISASEFLTRFLFPPEQQYTPLSKLSGGEKRRLHLLSVLFRNPNFLVLDEPTNDLDIPTLQVLEDFLTHFPGCVLLVSHDRYFMDRIVDHLFVFEGKGYIRDFPGNYSQYREAQHAFEAADTAKPSAEVPPAPRPATEVSVQGKKKLSYGEQRELMQLEQDMPRLQAEKLQLEQALAEGGTEYEALQESAVRIAEISRLLDEMELRWLVLDERR
jgi:ATP-binding cassette subfamily F protein uup